MKLPRFVSALGCVVLAALLVVCVPVHSASERTQSTTTWELEHDSEWVDAELVEEAAATFTEAQLAPVGGVCNTNIGPGICQAISQCHGQVLSGFCSGSASIKCCVSAGTATHAAATTSAAAPAAHACSSNGKAGLCLPVSSCSTGQTVSGLCPGNASIKCCIGATASSAAAPVAGAKACSHQGKAGSCIPTSQCKGSTVSGLCPGSADIKCCLGATSSGTAAPTLALAAASGSCSWAGKQGSCVDFRACQGTSFTGLCPGSTNIRCCVPGPKTKSRYVQQIDNTRKRRTFTVQPKLRAAADRMKLDEHKQKYTRFTRLHPNKARKDGSDFARFMSNRNSIIKLNDAFGTSTNPAPFGSSSPFANLSPSEFRARYLRSSHPNQKRHNASKGSSPAKKKSVSVRRTSNAAKPQLKTKGGSALLEMGEPKTGDGGVAGWGGQTGKKSGKTGGDSGDTASKSGKTGGDSGDTASKSGKTGGTDGDDAQKSGKTGGADDSSLDSAIQQYIPTWKKDTNDDTIGYAGVDGYYANKNHGFWNKVNRDTVVQSLLKAGVPQVDVESTWAILRTFALQMNRVGWSEDQGVCGSCWANAATQSAAQIAGLYYPDELQARRVSVQQILDCGECKTCAVNMRQI